jgi:hypothetical protein
MAENEERLKRLIATYVSIIEREIEESEEVYSRTCDVQAKITKFTGRSVGMINKSEVQVHETTNTEQNTDGNESG